jgi:hypothetical protein
LGPTRETLVSRGRFRVAVFVWPSSRDHCADQQCFRRAGSISNGTNFSASPPRIVAGGCNRGWYNRG